MREINEHLLQAVEVFVDLFGFYSAERFKKLYVGHFESWSSFVDSWIAWYIESGNPWVDGTSSDWISELLGNKYADKDGFIFLKH